MGSLTETKRVDAGTMTSLGDALRARRLALGMSFGQVAARSGVDKGTLYRIEAGSYLPKAEKLEGLSAALDIPLADLYGLVGLAPPKGLPTFVPYLRTKYRELPGPAIAELEAHFEHIRSKYGIDDHGPASGEDETPTTPKRTRVTKKGGTPDATTTKRSGTGRRPSGK